ncbi:restriction endonuclease [Draconibacterium sp.]|uniref:restriction endonuclease n=1 Tax=Draconibacterium sp. TaxID=1965318 RepID=UPI003561E3FA
MTANSEIGYLEAIDTSLDFIVEKIISKVSEYYTLNNEDLNFIELNRFERANIIVSNFYKDKNTFLKNNSNNTEKLIDLIYDSLAKPYFLDGTDIAEIEYFKENAINEENDEKYIFNNDIFSWYDMGKFDSENREELSTRIKKLLIQNKNNKTHTLDIIDVNLYNSIITNPQLLTSINWRTFEKLLADILEKFEYEIELLKGTKDGGIDIIAIKNQSPFGLNRYLIQAKQWKNKIGVEPVRSLIWAHNEYRATKSCLATTSVFTKGAWDLANKYKWQIELKDYDKILEWIKMANK